MGFFETKQHGEMDVFSHTFLDMCLGLGTKLPLNLFPVLGDGHQPQNPGRLDFLGQGLVG